MMSNQSVEREVLDIETLSKKEKWYIAIRRTFDSAHYIKDYPGKCSNLHGHTYIVEVKVGVPILNEFNIGVDFALLKHIVDKFIDRVDHKILNEVFNEPRVTAEYLAVKLYEHVSRELRIDDVIVKVYETPNSWVEYTRWYE